MIVCEGKQLQIWLKFLHNQVEGGGNVYWGESGLGGKTYEPTLNIIEFETLPREPGEQENISEHLLGIAVLSLLLCLVIDMRTGFKGDRSIQWY